MMEKLLSKKMLYRGKNYNVNEEVVELSSGKVVTRETIERLHKGASAVLLVDNFENVYLVKQFRHGIGKDNLEIPAGKFLEDEDPLTAAYREMEEETGLIPLNLKKLGEIYPTPGSDSRCIHIYYANDFIDGKTNFDEDEEIALVKMPLSEAKKLILDNTICDAKTICAILLYESLRNN